jgi:hypothetical protein
MAGSVSRISLGARLLSGLVSLAASGFSGCSGTIGPSGAVTSDSGGSTADGSTPADSQSMAEASSVGPAVGGSTPRMVAYVNVICGFGTGTRGGECLTQPDPTVNYVKQWEDLGTSPITHYMLAFLSFQGSNLQTDPGEIWSNGGGSTTDFTL